jgi:hypothetical protein
VSELVRQLLEDSRSGLRTDADGRRFFRPRRVRFRTIDISARELLLGGGWLRFEQALEAPFRPGHDPSHREIRDFAQRASERFIEFWYRVFDVAVARALAGPGDTRIFERPFLVPDVFFDIGIPREQSLSSIPPALHEKIYAEYRRSRDETVRFRIFYLSNFLDGLTDDVIAALEPYRLLWEGRERRRHSVAELGEIHRDLTGWMTDGFRAVLHAELDRLIFARLDRIITERGERHIADDAVRALIHRRRRPGNLTTLDSAARERLLAAADTLDLPDAARRIYLSLHLCQRAYDTARSAASLAASAYRLELQLARTEYARRVTANRPGASTPARGLTWRRDRYLALFAERLRQSAGLVHFGRSRTDEALWHLACLRELATQLPAGAPDPDLLRNWALPHAPIGAASEAAAQRDLEKLLQYPRTLSELRRTEADLVRLHFGEARSKAEQPDESRGRPEDRKDGPDAPELARQPVHDGGTRTGGKAGAWRYPGLEQLVLAEDERMGNPFQEARIVGRARELVLRRLRPVRRTASFYSLNPGHRHGAVTLNPVMKLWKDRPDLSRGGPRLIHLEMNTRAAVECLLRLTELVDRGLAEREVRREKIVRAVRGTENLANLTVLLLPGSCFPLREVQRADFPEFRGRVLGETRNPTELGVDPREDSILTGGWYQKYNHCLYYPVGGDNGRLLRLIWNSARAPGPAAFFFAAGQFVHDCLEDHLLYYRSREKTFRECVEDYYRQEDRIRKNRGEKHGRRKLDNSRDGVRFMFAVQYARFMMEALTGSSQSHFRHAATELWMMRHLNLPVLKRSDRQVFARIRGQAREIIESYGA